MNIELVEQVIDLYPIWHSLYKELSTDQKKEFAERADTKRLATLNGISTRFKKVLQLEEPAISNYPAKEEQALRTAIKNAEKHIPLLEQYHLRLKSASFTNKRFFVYFMYLGQSSLEPALGRSLLIFGDGNHVELENAREKTGDFSYPIGKYKRYANHIYINLTGERPAQHRELHIKAGLRSANQELAVGSYSTLEYGEIVTGSLIITKTDNQAKPKVISPFQDLSKVRPTVRPAIWDYLCLKSQNYAKVPREITGIDSLRAHIDKNAAIELTNRRFLENGLPTAFISAPHYSANSNDQQSFTNALHNVQLELKQSRIGSKVNVVTHFDSKSAQRQRSIEILKGLKRVRFFILFLGTTERLSFSLVELGWALAYVKYCIVYYPDGQISPSIEQLGGILGVEIIPYTPPLTSQVTVCAAQISERIEANLPTQD